jgi:REP-associated tyrosine transposase
LGSLLASTWGVLTGNAGHLGAFDYTGLYRYFLTFCTNGRHCLFINPEVVALVRSQILRSATDEQFAVVAYCFMPDHLHLLVEAQSQNADCRAFIKRAKQFAGFHYARTFGGRLWQRYGFERVLRDDEATLIVARYIIENPVRAGLVATPESYPFSGSELYALGDILAAVGELPRSG